MRKLLLIVAFPILASCTWYDGVRYGVYPADDQERYEMGKDNGPVLYSHLGPKGDWTVRSDYRRVRANISFQATPYNRVVFHLRTKMVKIPYDPAVKNVPYGVNLFLQGKYDEFMELAYPNEIKMRHLIEDQKRRDIYYKISDMGELKCRESGDYRHVGPSPDPAKGGQWAGMGAYERRLSFFCPLRKVDGDSDYRWYMSVTATYSIGHSSKVLGADGRQLMIEDIDRDFKASIFWALDSLELYGFDQKPYID